MRQEPRRAAGANKDFDAMDFDHVMLRRALAAVDVPVHREVVQDVLAAEPLRSVTNMQDGVWQVLRRKIADDD
jgi:hypothetical protein